jgi:predicted nucleic acid-binding protein
MSKIKVLLDTNVLIDVLSAERRSSTEYSDRIFMEIRAFRLEGVITIQSIADASYIFRHDDVSLSLFRDRILQIRNYVNIEPLDHSDLQDALFSVQSDFEDELQCSHAENSGCDFFITSDRKLKGRHTLYGMRICTPEEFVELLENLPSKPDSLPFLVPQKGR